MEDRVIFFRSCFPGLVGIKPVRSFSLYANMFLGLMTGRGSSDEVKQMEGFTRPHSASSDAEELSSSILGNDHSWNIALANANMTRAFGNTVIQPSIPLDSQFIHASVASSAHSFPGDLLSAGTTPATCGHRSDIEASMMNDSSCFIGNADSLSLHRQDTNSHISFPVGTNFGILPHQQQQSMPHNMSTFQQSSLCNLAMARDAVQFSGTNQHRGFLKDTANLQGCQNAMLDLNFSATGSSGHSMAMPQAAVAGYDLSKIQSLGCQTEDHGSEQNNMVISNSDSSSYSRNYDRRSMVVQGRTAAEGCLMPISDNHGIASHPLWGHADMDHWGQHRSQGTASLANSLGGHYLLNYDAMAYNCLSLNNIQQRNLNDASNFSRTPSGISIDSGNMRMRSGLAVTPSLQSPLVDQLQQDIYPLARLNQKPCSSAPMYHHRAQVATPSASPLYRGVQMAAPESNRQAMQMDWNFSDISLATASPGGSVFPDTTSRAGAGGECMRPYTSTEKSDATVVPTHKRKMCPPSGPRTVLLVLVLFICRCPHPSKSSLFPLNYLVRPIRPLHISIPPKYPGSRGKYNPRPAPEPKRLKATEVIDFKMQQGTSNQSLGYKCSICKRDVTYAPEGPITVPTAPLPVAVLACGHTFHDQCLQAITPKGQEKDPPCIPCAIGED
ncbi:hypothetical protein MLD38_029380 [Melastoma candidum]|uniref:Uncharacterized protein n=1 Tax=Melastoma candidum TaxID=119954 RepID=A0ACB9N3T1_9MYRT|nr:hypothetical protein MLD38_029380 [Melastoma candidum]